MHALLPPVNDVWWATPPEPREIHATAQWPDVLRHDDLGLDHDLMHEVFPEAVCLAGKWEKGCSPRAREPPGPPAACRRRATTSPYADFPPPGAPPWGRDRHRPPDHGATSPGAEINVQACFAAPLAHPSHHVTTGS